VLGVCRCPGGSPAPSLARHTQPAMPCLRRARLETRFALLGGANKALLWGFSLSLVSRHKRSPRSSGCSSTTKWRPNGRAGRLGHLFDNLHQQGLELSGARSSRGVLSRNRCFPGDRRKAAVPSRRRPRSFLRTPTRHPTPHSYSKLTQTGKKCLQTHMSRMHCGNPSAPESGHAARTRLPSEDDRQDGRGAIGGVAPNG